MKYDEVLYALAKLLHRARTAEELTYRITAEEQRFISSLRDAHVVQDTLELRFADGSKVSMVAM